MTRLLDNGRAEKDFLLLNPAVDVAHPQEMFYKHYERQEDMLNMGLAALAAYLKSKRVSFDILDSNIRRLSPEETLAGIPVRKFNCIGFSLNAYNVLPAVRLVRKLRRGGFRGHITAGGAFASLYPGYLLSGFPEFDSIVYGDGEAAACELAGRLRTGKDWRQTRGIVYAGQDGSPVTTAPSNVTSDLDSLPRPLRYARTPMPQPVELARGCYGSCSFCSLRAFYSLSGNRAARRRALPSVFDEVEELFARGCRDFEFQADNFFPSARTAASDRYLREFSEEIRRRGLGIRFSISCRSNDISRNRLRALKACGLTGIFMGVESVDPSELSRFNKGVGVKDIAKAINLLRSEGVNFGCGYIFFSPWSDMSALARSANFMVKVGLSHFPYGAYRMKVHPGTPARDAMDGQGLLRAPGSGAVSPEAIYHQYGFADPLVGIIWEKADALYRRIYAFILERALAAYKASDALTQAKNLSDMSVLRFVAEMIESRRSTPRSLESFAARRFPLHLRAATALVRGDLERFGRAQPQRS